MRSDVPGAAKAASTLALLLCACGPGAECDASSAEPIEAAALLEPATPQPLLSFDTGAWIDSKTGRGADVHRTNFRHGAGSILLNVGDPIASHAVTRSGVSLDIAGSDVLTLWVYFPEEYKDARVSVWLQQRGTWGTRFALTIGSPSEKGWAGWTPVEFPTSAMTAYGGATWGERVTGVQVWLGSNTTPNARAWADALFRNTRGVPQVVWTFDDGGASDYSEAFSYLHPRGMSATSFIVSSYIGNRISLNAPQMHEMNSAGWDFGNHSATHPLFEKITADDRVRELTKCMSWLAGHGLARSGAYLGYPGSGYSGVEADVRAAGIVAGRTSTIGLVETASGLSNQYRLPTCISMKGTTTLEAAKARIQETIDQGKTCFIMGHDLAVSPTVNGWTIEDFRALADFVAEKKDANLLSVRTFREWLVENGPVSPLVPAFIEGVAPVTALESDPITVTGRGLGDELPVGVAGGQYAVSRDGTTWSVFTSDAAFVRRGDRVKLRHVTAQSPLTVATTMLDVGGFVVPFTTETRSWPLATPWIDYPAASGTGSIAVRWEAVQPGATYVVEESADATFAISKEVFRGTATTATVTGRTNGTYWYRVKAKSPGYLDSSWRVGSRPCTVTLKMATQ
jgi:peptidoglycan/xylan/chitin deacetylase (PgdA/CDA1 family)